MAVQNIVVVGGSYVGKATAQKLAQVIPRTYRILLVEPHTHFHHIFTFPRFSLVRGNEHKAFIPYSATFSASPDATSHAIIPARVLSVKPRSLTLDREWLGTTEIPFAYLVVATGTTLSQPSAVKEDEKEPAIRYLRRHQDQVKQSKRILIVGGGAAGVQMATDLKEYYPDKQITLVQSRDRLMPKFEAGLHELIKRRFEDLGITMVTGARVVVPAGGFPNQSGSLDVHLTNGASVATDFVILATGQQANNSLISDLPSTDGTSLVNPDNGMIRVRPTLQFADPKYDNLFAVGDIADTGAHKAAKPGVVQAGVVAANIHALIEGRSPDERFTTAPAGIHMTLGMKYNVVFVNPAEGQSKPKIIEKQDGLEDMNVDSMWERMGIPVERSSDYNL